jgi:hypothetical protein
MGLWAKAVAQAKKRLESRRFRWWYSGFERHRNRVLRQHLLKDLC